MSEKVVGTYVEELVELTSTVTFRKEPPSDRLYLHHLNDVVSKISIDLPPTLVFELHWNGLSVCTSSSDFKNGTIYFDFDTRDFQDGLTCVMMNMQKNHHHFLSEECRKTHINFNNKVYDVYITPYQDERMEYPFGVFDRDEYKVEIEYLDISNTTENTYKKTFIYAPNRTYLLHMNEFTARLNLESQNRAMLCFCDGIEMKFCNGVIDFKDFPSKILRDATASYDLLKVHNKFPDFSLYDKTIDLGRFTTVLLVLDKELADDEELNVVQTFYRVKTPDEGSE